MSTQDKLIPYEATCVFDNYTKIYKGIINMESNEKIIGSPYNSVEYYPPGISYQDKVKEFITPTSTKLVVEDMIQRETFGYNKYGKYLSVNTDEDMLQHLYEELLDGAVYIRTLIEQRKKK